MSDDVMPVGDWQAEVDLLRADEAIIEAGLATFVEVGQALARIRDGRRYRLEGYATFEAYCRERWNLSRPRAYELMEAAQVAERMSGIPDIPAIANQGQAREVAAIIKSDGPERAAEILTEVADTGKVTAKAIREAARPTKKVTVVEEVTVDAETGEIVEPPQDIEAHPLVANDPDYRHAVIRRDLMRHVKNMGPPVAMTPQQAAAALAGSEGELDLILRARRSIDEWCDQLQAELKPKNRLRIVGDDQ